MRNPKPLDHCPESYIQIERHRTSYAVRIKPENTYVKQFKTKEEALALKAQMEQELEWLRKKDAAQR